MSVHKSWFALALATLLAGGSAIAVAGDIKVNLSGDQEVPPVETSASGSGTIMVEDDKSIKGSITTSGMDGTAAHIHEGPVGKNGPDIITLVETSPNEWSVPKDAVLTDLQYDAYQAGNLYVNIHSDAHKGGEIRGQLKKR